MDRDHPGYLLAAPRDRKEPTVFGVIHRLGQFAEKIIEGHDNRPGGRLEDHPLYRLKEVGGKILLLGVDHGINSTIHVAEWIAVRDCGVNLPESWKEFVGDFRNVDEPLDRRRGQVKGRVGDAEVRLVDTPILFRVVAEILKKKIRQEFESWREAAHDGAWVGVGLAPSLVQECPDLPWFHCSSS